MTDIRGSKISKAAYGIKLFGNKYTLANPLDLNKLITYYNQNPEKFELNIEDKLVDEALEAFEAEENVYAGFDGVNKLVKQL